MNVIYETTGRAREFAELALNHYTGCGHGCSYCYVPGVIHADRLMFHAEPVARLTPGDIQRSAAEFAARGERRPILLSFTSDPYQPLDEKEQLTRVAIELLKEAGLRVVILTKGGHRAARDLDLLGPGDAFAVSLTCAKPSISRHWEPGAAPPEERIVVLEEARARGLATWVSLEPVLYPRDTFELIEATAASAGHFKLGTLNYHPHAQTIDWLVYLMHAEALLQSLKKPYYVKKDLARMKGLEQGYWWGIPKK
jgi:DNA repair photolyase